jgi:hypothetical protein
MSSSSCNQIGSNGVKKVTPQEFRYAMATAGPGLRQTDEEVQHMVMEVNVSRAFKSDKRMNYIELVHNLIATACHSDKDESHMALYSDTESMQEEEKLDVNELLQGVHKVLRD